MMTDAEKVQLLGRVMLAANEYIRQLESEISDSSGTVATRTEMARVKWQQILPEGQEAFL